MDEKPSHIKQLSLIHVCKIGLTQCFLQVRWWFVKMLTALLSSWGANCLHTLLAAMKWSNDPKSENHSLRLFRILESAESWADPKIMFKKLPKTGALWRICFLQPMREVHHWMLTKIIDFFHEVLKLSFILWVYSYLIYYLLRSVPRRLYFPALQ